jgi:hypothetical protein
MKPSFRSFRLFLFVVYTMMPRGLDKCRQTSFVFLINRSDTCLVVNYRMNHSVTTLNVF